MTTLPMKCGLSGQQVCKEQGDLGPHSSSLCGANVGKSGVMGLKEPAWLEDLEDCDSAAISYIIV